MSTRTTSHLLDCSTLANYKAWAQEISNAMSAFGWQSSGDTGIVAWSGVGASQLPLSTAQAPIFFSCNITSTTFSSPTVTCNYSNFVGTTPAIGQWVTIAGSAPGNRGTFRITAVSAGVSFGVANAGGAASGVAGTAAAGAIAWANIGATNYLAGQVATAGSNTYMCTTSAGSGANTPPNTTYWSPFNYEIWESNDGLSAMFLLIEYWVQTANAGVANSQPKTFLTAGTSTSGIGGIPGPGGFATGRVQVSGDAAALSLGAFSQTTYWQPWYMSGSPGRAAFFLYANPGMSIISPYFYNQQMFAIERDHDNTGADASTGFTLVTASTQGATTANRSQQSVNHTSGATSLETAQWMSPLSTLTITVGNLVSSSTLNDSGNGSFGTVAFPIFPNTGGLGNQLLCVMLTQNPTGNLGPVSNFDHGALEEGAIVQVQALGSLHTYVAAGGFALTQVQGAAATRFDMLLVRFE